MVISTEMAETSPPAPTTEEVGNTFVQQYYGVLLAQPDLAHRFYEESSVLGRPGPNGLMVKVTTLQGIKQMILSFDYIGCKAEIKTVDSLDSCKEGVIVLVTGWLTGKDHVTRSFSQTFFLAPQPTGYYVLNDVFRFVDEVKASTPSESEFSDANENAASTPSTPKQESAHAPIQLDQSPRSPPKAASQGSEACESSDTKDSPDSDSVVKEVVSEQPLSSSQNGGLTVSVKSVPKDQENRPKMSYASIVAKESTVTSPVHTPTVIVKASSTHYLDRASPKAAAAAPPSNNRAPQKSITLTEGKAIYIGNLPSDITDEQLDEVLKTFGPVKKDGIQIRKYNDGFCYGFVEFVSSSAARSAVEAHHIMIGSNEAYITEKKSPNQGNNGRGKFASGKGDFRNDSYRNRENVREGRSYGGSQNGNRDGDFGGQYKSPRGSNGESRQRVYQNGGGSTPRGRSSGSK
ncbi:nuclear transport factor 2-like [Rhododendron vialii]|uniref:nuclear transport factor 2-like n=1 Tax=Rhododendron vialii TaxID=182163 RepID=UPI00265FCC7C|nr:nuclear transport factor 2-like [Rhododendron vialii]XP_058193626.1 nuclear transport factor 2-like [Rhododendron vialii]